MAFQIHALAEEPFANLFSLSDATLAARCARRMIVEKEGDIPCRISLEDAPPGRP